MRAILVEVDGRPRFERYYSSSAGQSRSVFSVTKSVMSTLVGIAVGEGKLRLDDPLSTLLPHYAATMTPHVAQVTLRQLLTMTGGFPDDWSGTSDQVLESSPDWTRFILAHQETAPGAQFHHSNYGAHLLSPILVQATGRSVLSYARAKLFDPPGNRFPARHRAALRTRQPGRIQRSTVCLASRSAGFQHRRPFAEVAAAGPGCAR